ncbi:MAG: hypothetical protein Kow0029_04060 [Candidatus Rifleibacteriota bacterium]
MKKTKNENVFPGSPIGYAAKALFILVWTCICLFPAAWSLFQSDEQYKRYKIWCDYSNMRYDGFLSVINLEHYFRFPAQHSILVNSPERINWNELTKEQLDAKDSFGFSCLGYAAMFNNSKIAAELIKKGADVNLRQKNNAVPLYIAAYERSKDVIQVLLDNGAATDLQDVRGQSPLHYAAKKEYLNIISQSDRDKTNFEVTTLDGMTPMDIAVSNKNVAAVMALAIAGASISTNVTSKSPLIDAYFALCMKLEDPSAAARVMAEADPNSNFQKLKRSWDFPAELPVDLGKRAEKKWRSQ